MKKRIALVTGRKAYLPEQYAYKAYFESHQYQVELLPALRYNRFSEYDIVWKFMGADKTKRVPGVALVHEFQSIPVDAYPPLRHLKKDLKKILAPKPDLRVFKNAAVREFFGFRDDVPVVYRDMGVHHSFFDQPPAEKKYDFVYLGEISPVRKTDRLVRYFTEHLQDRSLLLIGHPTRDIAARAHSHSNIFLAGKKAYHEVPALLAQCRFGMHYVPDRFPFNVQLSTKLIEYCAAGLPVVTNRSAVTEQFAQKFQGRFYAFSEDFSDFDIEALESFDFRVPDVSDLEWSLLLDRSGLLPAIGRLV